MTALSALSRTTSISNSFHPISDSSINTSLIGLELNPFCTNSAYSSALYAMEPPVPPSVNDGLIITGNPISAIIDCASSSVLTKPPFAVGTPAASIFSLNFSLFSALSIASTLAPISSTLYFSRIPL